MFACATTASHTALDKALAAARTVAWVSGGPILDVQSDRIIELMEKQAIFRQFCCQSPSLVFDLLRSPFAKQLLRVLEDNPNANFLPLMNQLVVKVGLDTKFEQVPSVTIEGGIPEACLAAPLDAAD